ncbi:hypothetical protein KIH39_22840 [Telmatocola sphagniphila]|uniref:Uncharacterized protein n=1 Tax=Telmatocola sphagniphila TaxID=1123043 RepID=A0A8E6B4L0_9BACT|nr:hypothetical protein [Telmatocola sphagniphila]QVL31651.1 hypothetical protein KIH39_22840 [Telmatocola sphagniphila]
MADSDFPTLTFRFTSRKFSPLIRMMMTSIAGVAKDTSAIQGKYRKQLRRLRDTQLLSRFSSESRYNFAVNCPPVGASCLMAPLRVCNFASFCPFCYARRVVAPVYRTCQKLLSDRQNRQMVLLGYRVGVSIPSYVPSNPIIWSGQLAREFVDFIDGHVHRDKMTLYSEFDAYAAGGAVLTSESFSKDSVAVHRSGVILVKDTMVESPRWVRRDLEHENFLQLMSRKDSELQSFVANIFSYKQSLLTMDNPRALAFYLDALQGMHMFRRVNCFRGKRK